MSAEQVAPQGPIIPQRPEGPPEGGSTTSKGERAASRPATILLVDDEAEIRAALAGGLERIIAGSRVLTAPDAKHGLAILAREPVDVIISDQKMPGMSGSEFLAEARRVAPDATRMMLTAFPEEQLLERKAEEARVRYFFTKPCSIVEIAGNVRHALRHQEAQAARVLQWAGPNAPVRG